MTLHFSWWKEGWEKTALLKRQPYLYFSPRCRDKPCAGLCGTSQNGSPWTDFSLGTVETHTFFCVSGLRKELKSLRTLGFFHPVLTLEGPIFL